MAETFEDLGLRPALAETTRGEGYTGPTALQRAAIPVLRRGGNAVLHASAGAGVVAAYGLALLDRLAEGGSEEGGAGEPRGTRALVLVPTDDEASRIAVSLARFARPIGVTVAALGAGWARPALTADVAVAGVAAALDAVQTSQLKLEAVETLVLNGASTAFALGRQEAIETLTGLVPRDAQRVVTTADLTREVTDYVERHVRRALHIPPIPAEPSPPPMAEPARPIDYAMAGDAEKLDLIAIILAERPAAARAEVYCRTERRAAEVADALALRGFRTEPGDVAEIVVAVRPTEAASEALTISYDVPFDADSLGERHAAGGMVLIAPRELPHLRQIAERAGFRPRPRSIAVPVPARDEVAAFRDQLRRALSEEDLGAQLLVLDPLLAEATAAEVAAAASALLRRRVPARAEAVPPRAAAPVSAPTPAYVRLFISVGAKDGVGPGDLVGAITGEAKVDGSKIGKIEIRDTFSVVEVTTDIADRVIRALNGTTLRGRSLRVDYDRRGVGAVPRVPGERARRRVPRASGRRTE